VFRRPENMRNVLAITRAKLEWVPVVEITQLGFHSDPLFLQRVGTLI
jgi:hypothetical protein